MLSLAKLGRGSEGYYLVAVAKGAEDYYVGRGEAPGYWAGRGAELLGLDEEVTPEVLRAILAGLAPDGSMLGASNRKVPASTSRSLCRSRCRCSLRCGLSCRR